MARSSFASGSRIVVAAALGLLTLGLRAPCPAAADTPDAGLPRPDDLGSHEQFKKMLDRSRDSTYRKILALYDQALAVVEAP